MMEALATIGIIAIGCVIEVILTTVAMKVNLKLAEKEL